MIPNPTDSFEVPPRSVVHERLGDEVLAINLDQGAYFAMVGVSADVWSSIAPGVSLQRIGQALADRYGIDADQVVDELLVFVGDLADHGLLVPGTADDSAALPVVDGSAGSWGELQLERYDDMADLVLLDPIHQVDEAGWPHQPRAT